MKAAITRIEYHLPETTLDNAQLAELYPAWTAQRIEEKVGVVRRHIAAEGECSSDLAVKAATALFDSGAVQRENVEFVILCTQSPDYFLPTTACLLQDRLGLRRGVGAFDFNLGCSGFVYGLSIAKGLIETGQVRNVLLLTAETYSKFIRKDDHSVRTIFGDAAAATLIEGVDGDGSEYIGPFVFGTDGSGAKNLIVSRGAIRQPPGEDETGHDLYMNGSAVFSFTLEAVPAAVRELAARSGLALDTVNHFVFHQASRFMLDHLRQKLKIDPSKFPMCLRDCGNTVSSTIPITLAEMQRNGSLRADDKLMLVGFGVGFSWCAAMVRWTGKN